MRILHGFFSSLVKEPNHLVASFWSLAQNLRNERPRTNDQIVVDLTGFGPVISSLQMKRITAVLQARLKLLATFYVAKSTKKILLVKLFYEDPFLRRQ